MPYEIYRQVTGANGKTGDQYQATEQLIIDESREVTAQFLANNNANMPWQFRPSSNDEGCAWENV